MIYRIKIAFLVLFGKATIIESMTITGREDQIIFPMGAAFIDCEINILPPLKAGYFHG